MKSRRVALFGLVGILFSLWFFANGCNLDATGFGDTEEACTIDAHCDDQIVCTADKCDPNGTCVHTPVEDGEYPDGITGNCKVFECKSGEQTDKTFPDDVDDGDECTIDKCTADGATHTVQAGATCHLDGGVGRCGADGKCSIDCGGLDDSGNEVGCPASDDPCSVSYCDKAQGKCALDALDGVAKPGTTPGDCGGTYCIKGKSTEQFAVKGTACAGTTPGGKPAIVCDDGGKCVGCNDAKDCDPDNIGTSFCFTATCTNAECNVTTQADGTVLPPAMQIVGDCKEKRCQSLKPIEVPLDSDVHDDQNLCTTDTCVGGVITPVPTGLNSPCGANGTLFCDGAGTCQNCTEADQCGIDNDCHQFACNGGTCMNIYPPVNTPVSVAGQTAGDCLLQVCDGIGGIKPNADDGDLPNDGNDCTLDQCSGGTKVFPPVAVSSVCSQNRICDANGNCLGNTCQGVADCAAGAFCVDGVCCNSACATVCGACTNTLKGTGLNGDCGTSAPGIDNNDTDCPGPKVCDGTLGAGACKLPVGQPCSVSAECLVGNCVDGYCCNNACAGVCQVCNAAGTQGTCTNIPFGQDPANECAGAVNCNGTGACGNLFGNGTPCSMGTECQSGFCTDGVCCSAQCSGNCQSCVLANNVGTCLNIPVEQDPSNECAGTLVCNGAGLCKQPQGSACAVASDCASGFCTDGVCCNVACGGVCQACSLAGSVGTCSNIGSGQDPAAECPGATNCNGNGACALFSNGTACSMGTECSSGNCIDGVCCNSTCTGTCRACNVAGSVGTCANIPNLSDPANECTGAQVCNGAAACVGGPNGAGCGGNSECATMQCVDGVCCNNACNTACKACNIAGSVGTCSNIANGQDPASECAGATTCNGAGACGLFANGTACAISGECQSGNCVDGVCCGSASCLSCQTCNGGTPGTCTNLGNGVVDNNPVGTCTGVNSCDGAGGCKKNDGQVCAVNSDCVHAHCVDGVCCNVTCGSLCQACNVAGSVGTCTNVPNGTDPANECAGTTNCNGAGACGLLSNGTACSVNGECNSMQCVDGVCCNNACGTTCMACNLAGSPGTCTNIPNGQDPANECPGATTCNGSAACGLFALGAACSANGECASTNCVDGVCCSSATCSGTCKSCNQADTVGAVAGVCDFIKANSDPGNECTTECNGAGACEAPAGTSCSTGAECQSGNCVDGVCCGSSSCAACQACNVAGNLGTCTNIAVDGTDNNPVGTCTGNNACDGAGICKKKDGQACSGSNAECVHNHCTDGFCCDLACGGTCEACSAALSGGSDGVCGNLIPNTDPANECTGAQVCSMMGTCVTAPNGATCPVNGTDNNCSSTFCVDGVCCSGVCDLKCEACTNALTGGTTGTCTGIPAGQDPENECPGGNVCDGNHGCQ